MIGIAGFAIQTMQPHAHMRVDLRLINFAISSPSQHNVNVSIDRDCQYSSNAAVVSPSTFFATNVHRLAGTFHTPSVMKYPIGSSSISMSLLFPSRIGR